MKKEGMIQFRNKIALCFVLLVFSFLSCHKEIDSPIEQKNIVGFWDIVSVNGKTPSCCTNYWLRNDGTCDIYNNIDEWKGNWLFAEKNGKYFLSINCTQGNNLQYSEMEIVWFNEITHRFKAKDNKSGDEIIFLKTLLQNAN